MQFHVYLVVDHGGDWVAAGMRDCDNSQIVEDWDIAHDYLRANVYRVEVDAADILERAEVIRVVGNYVSKPIPE